MDEVPTAFDQVGRLSLKPDGKESGVLMSGAEDSNATTQFEFASSPSTNLYSFDNNAISAPHSANKDNVVEANRSPLASHFWFDDSERIVVDHEYEDPSNSVKLLHPTHSDVTHLDDSLTLCMRHPSQDPIENVYLACETRSEGVEIQPYVQDTSSKKEVLTSKPSEEPAEIKRDKLTGKFKQSCTDPSGTTEKLCKVCNDRAVNHNFGQLTCESCKAFFRRNAHKVSET
ncbi:Nuclear hormone receptor family member nhr-48 [Fasciolopsis buskii]|uniref:Nuclear hormone receptor family member nhr-48 n=1 Tax=Fasciolopsis buskii TaxID=27845 RepID=A0A8E0VGK0_9TREM|nr:Nuclear hormone receptor family member nhr-48 [Fasciolopsis buski]